MSIGQGEVLVAPLQMANLAAIFANKGWYYDPHVVRAVGHPDSLQRKYLTKHNTGVDPKKWYEPIQEGMRRVVEEPGGTARNARIEGITVCGKTGTAETHMARTMPCSFASPPWRTRGSLWRSMWRIAGSEVRAAPIASLLMEQYLTDTIKRPEVMKRMLEADSLLKEATFVKKPKKPRRR